MTERRSVPHIIRDMEAYVDGRALNYVFCHDGDTDGEKRVIERLGCCKSGVNVVKTPKNEYFLMDPRNPNHFNISRYWTSVIPSILGDCGISYDVNDFTLHEQKDPVYGYDLSYHELSNDDRRYEMIPLSVGCESADGTHHHVFREGSGMSMYHRLCRNTHFSYEIMSDTSDRSCVILCDSMSSPVIPILAYYFGNITVFDVCHNNRTTCDVMTKVSEMCPDVLISMHSDINIR